MDNSFDPWASVRAGQQAQQSLAEAQAQGISLRERLALKKAAGAMGSQNYFAGYEGVPGAERPDYLKQAWEGSDPADAAKLEALVAEPFKVQRSIETAGKIEAAKKAADLEYNKNMMREFFGSEGGQAANAFGASLSSTTPSMATSNDAPSTRPSVALSPMERSFEVGPLGPKFGVKQLSPFEQSMKIGEDEARRETTTLAKTKESRETLQSAHDNVRKVTDQIMATQQAMQARDLSWDLGQEQLAKLRADKQEFVQRRDALLRGTVPTALPQDAAPSIPPMRSSTTPTPSTGPPLFTEKEQGAMNVKGREEQITAGNKEIANARLGVEKVTKFLPQIKELHKIVTTEDIGHPALDSVYGAGNVLSLNRANAQVKKLNEAIINMFAEPGQSQMMNTIVERQMQGAVVPGLFTDPQLNKMNSATLLSNVEHLRNLPTFLEQWQKAHNGSLNGAADAWIDYTDHNRRYTYQKDARGKVAVSENKQVRTPEAWQKLRSQGKVKDIGEKTLVQQQDGSWLAQ